MIDKYTMVMLTSLLAIVSLPSFSYVNFGSMSYGYLVALLIVIFLLLISGGRSVSTFSMLNLTAVYIVFSILMGSSLVSYLVIEHEVTYRTLLSSVLLFISIFTAFYLSSRIPDVPNQKFIFCFKIIALLLAVSAFISYFGFLNIGSYSNYVKSIFPFAEPSHFALSAGPVFLAIGFYYEFKMRIVIFVMALSISLLYPSMVLLVYAFLMFILYFDWKFKVSSLFIAAITTLIYINFIGELDYFAYFIERISFSETTNLTALVYLQGWSLIPYYLRETYFLGVGFQNMGVLDPILQSHAIAKLAGEYKNLNDGSFLVSKIIAELGLVGMMLIVLYLLGLMKYGKYIIKFRHSVNAHNSKYFFSSIVYVSFFIELFGRGYGYFSSSSFLFLVSLFFLLNKRSVAKDGVIYDKNRFSVVNR